MGYQSEASNDIGLGTSVNYGNNSIGVDVASGGFETGSSNKQTGGFGSPFFKSSNDSNEDTSSTSSEPSPSPSPVNEPSKVNQFDSVAHAAQMKSAYGVGTRNYSSLVNAPRAISSSPQLSNSHLLLDYATKNQPGSINYGMVSHTPQTSGLQENLGRQAQEANRQAYGAGTRDYSSVINATRDRVESGEIKQNSPEMRDYTHWSDQVIKQAEHVKGLNSPLDYDRYQQEQGISTGGFGDRTTDIVPYLGKDQYRASRETLAHPFSYNPKGGPTRANPVGASAYLGGYTGSQMGNLSNQFSSPAPSSPTIGQGANPGILYARPASDYPEQIAGYSVNEVTGGSSGGGRGFDYTNQGFSSGFNEDMANFPAVSYEPVG